MDKKIKSIKFLHCSDLHMDCPFSSLSNTHLAKKRRQALKDVFSRIIDIAYEENVNFLFVCGDLFEQNYTDLASINFINECFKRIPKTNVLLVCGNHDPSISNSHYSNYNWNDNVLVFKSHISYAYFDECDTYIYGSSFCAFEEQECTIPDFDVIDKNGINIFLTHGTLGFDSATSKYNPLDFNFLQNLGMDYIGLGHFHNTFIKENIYNPGSPEPLGFDECGKHGVFLGSIDKTSDLKMDVRFIDTNITSYNILDVNMPKIDNDLSVINAIKNKIAADIYDPKNTLLQLNLKGYIQNGINLDMDYIYSSICNDLFYAKIIDNTVPDYDWELIATEPGLRGLFVSKMLTKIKTSQNESIKKTLYMAMHYGIQAIDNNKIEI